VVNVEPVDLSLPSFLYCVLYVVNVEPVDPSLRNEGRDRSTGSTLITHKAQEMREGIGQPVQH
jgi:hypothetical protein